MPHYINKFEEAVDTIPYSNSWVDMANDVLQLIFEVFYDDCPLFLTMQSLPGQNGDHFRTVVFEIYGSMYLYNDLVRDDHMECSQLERIIQIDKDWNNVVSMVLYSSDPTPEPLSQVVLNVYKHTKTKVDWMPSLNKRPQ
ncbi:MAG: hypothetical protein IK073_05855 [Paludibacteraceae bacterium]|nr:hypothetical protein [Paludibacteraceae bacterium]